MQSGHWLVAISTREQFLLPPTSSAAMLPLAHCLLSSAEDQGAGGTAGLRIPKCPAPPIRCPSHRTAWMSSVQVRRLPDQGWQLEPSGTDHGCAAQKPELQRWNQQLQGGDSPPDRSAATVVRVRGRTAEALCRTCCAAGTCKLLV